MRGQSKTELHILNIQAHSKRSRDRYEDMQIAVYGPGEKLPRFRVGGRWDANERRYVGPAEDESRIDVTAAQAPAWDRIEQWLIRFITAHRKLREGEAATIDEALRATWGDDGEPLFTLQLYGGRQGGKTHIAALTIAIVGVAIPGARCVVVSPIIDKTEEIVDIIEQYALPSRWRVTKADEIRLINGSEILLRSGKVADHKAIGPIHIALVNEAQEQKQQSWTDLQGLTLKHGGLVLLAQNPPRRRIGEWTQTLYESVKKGEQPGTVSVWVNPALNPFTSDIGMRHLGNIMDERTMKREVLGDMGVPIGDVALHRWSDSAHVITWIPTTWVDVTQEVTEEIFGRPSARIGGLDWDKGAGCCYAVGRILRPHNAPRYAYTLVMEYGHRCKGLPEAKFAKHLKGLQDKYGYPLMLPASMVWVGDASSRTQSSYRHHDEGDPPSWERMQREGWWIEYPDAIAKRNPRRADRFSLINQYVLPPQPVTMLPRVVFVADTAQEIIADARSLPRKGLEADKWSPHAHLTDAWTYLCFRLWSQDYAREVNDGIPESVKRTMGRKRL